MNIEILIEKYYNGETSPEEELILSEHFANSAERSPEKDLFDCFAQEEVECDINFEDMVVAKISADEKIIKPKFNTFWTITAVAATFLLFFGIFQFTDVFNFGAKQQGIVINDSNIEQNKELAKAEAQKALQLISSTFEAADKNMEKLEYLNKTDVLSIFFDDKINN